MAKSKTTSYLFYGLFTVVLLIRFSLIRFPSFHIDMTDFQAWTGRLVDMGPLHFYSPNYFSDYFPGYLYMLWLFGSIASWFGSHAIFSSQFGFFLKTITMLFEIGSAYIIYKILLRYNQNWARIGSLIYLINPALVFNSAVWGQIDGIFTFFLILVFYYLVEQKKWLKFTIVFSIATLIKPQSVMILPVSLLYLYLATTVWTTIKSLIIIGLIVYVLSFPFYAFSNPLFGLVHSGLSSTSVYPYTSLFAFNFWSIVGFWQSDTTPWLGISYKIWGLLIGGFFVLLPYCLLLKDRSLLQGWRVYLFASLQIMAFYLFFTRMHDRYLFPFFVFFLIAACIKKSKLLLISYGIMTAIHFFNLWYVYYYYNVIYNNPPFHHNGLYDFIDQSYRFWSVVSIIIFFVALTYFYLYGKHAEN